MSYDKTELLLPMDGANAGTVFTDWSRRNRAVSVINDAQTSTAQSKFYGSSGLFDGTNDYLRILYDTNLNIEASDFYIGAWCYIKSSANPQVLISMRRTATSGSAGWSFNVTPAAFLFQYNGGSSLTYSTGLTLNTWIHLAVSRSGTTARLFLDGTVVQTNSSFADGTVDTVSDVIVGRAGSDLASGSLNAHVQDLVLIKGAAVHTANFTPPGKLIGTLSNQGTGGEAVKDDTGSAAVRRIYAVPRIQSPTASRLPCWNAVSDGSGLFSISVPSAAEFSDIAGYSVIALDDAAGTTYNDLVHAPSSTT